MKYNWFIGIIGIILLSNIVSSLAPAGYYQGEYYTTGANDVQVSRNDRHTAQSFTVGTTGLNETMTLNSVGLNITTTTGGVLATIEIYELNITTNRTLNTSRIAFGSFNTSIIVGSTNYTYINLTERGLVQKGKYYGIFLNGTGTLAGGTSIQWAWNTTGRYYGGRAMYDDGLGTWTDEASYDFMFDLVGDYYYNFTENYQTYNSTTTSNSPENFEINITYNSTKYSPIVSLIYNGTSYSPIQIGVGDTIAFTTQVIVPNVSVSVTKNFYWEIILNKSGTLEYYNSSIKTQTINPVISLLVVSGICQTGYRNAFYFITLDESTRDIISQNIEYNLKYSYGSSIGSIYGNITNIQNLSICINSTLTNQYTLEGEIDYYSTNYTKRTFYIIPNTRTSNESINNSLYGLLTSSSTNFLFTVKNNQYIPLSSHYLSILRWYPSLNNYAPVNMGRTDNDGQIVMNVLAETIDYRIGVYSPNGTLLQLFPPVRFVCTAVSCPYNLYVSTITIPFFTLANMQYDLSFNSSTKIFTFIWNDPTQQTQLINLTVWKEQYGIITSVCSSSGSSYTGILTCDVSSQTGLLRATVTRVASPLVPIAQLIVNLSQQITDIAGGKTMGLLMGFILFTFAVLVGIYSPVVSIILGIFSLIPVLWIGVITPTIFGAVIVIGFVVIHFIRRS